MSASVERLMSSNNNTSPLDRNLAVVISDRGCNKLLDLPVRLKGKHKFAKE